MVFSNSEISQMDALSEQCKNLTIVNKVSEIAVEEALFR
jgi:hypothetical protein